ncbi:MAG: LysR family transcriptional regulator [Lysobacter sp.]
MDRFHLMSVFVAVAEEESFAAAARRLGLSAPAVTRAVAALEERLAIKLLDRTTRFVRATEAGRRYLADARRILQEVDEVEEAAAGVNAAPRGHLTVTAPVQFGRMFVLPVVVEYLRRYPAAQVSALFLDRVVNLLEEGVDVGVRIGELPDSSLQAIKVATVRRVLCASPDYLRERGEPRTPADLAGHDIVSALGISPTVEWKFGRGKATQSQRIEPRLATSSNDSAIAAAASGFGIARLMSYQIAPHLAAGTLRIVLTEYEPAPVPVHVLHREGRYASAKLRTFVDLIVATLRGDRALN